MKPLHRIPPRACPTNSGRVFPSDYVLLRAIGLPHLWIRTLMLGRQAHAAHVWCADGYPGRAPRTRQFIPMDQADDSLRDVLQVRQAAEASPLAVAPRP